MLALALHGSRHLGQQPTAQLALGRVPVLVREADVAPMQVQGPRSREVIQALFGEAVASLRYYWCAETDVDGIPVVVSRTGWTGEVGFEIYLRGSLGGEDLWERVLDAGAPFRIRAIAPSEARRIEAGIFNYGSDMRVEDTPFHVTGLERLVERQDADYLGKAALERLRSEGVDRKLVGIDIGGPPLDSEGALSDFRPVLSEGTTVGRVTAAAYSPRLEQNIGFAWVPVELAETGTRLEVPFAEGTGDARVAALPFVDPNKEIPKS